jgi:proteasome lid subunit RPN8/RPN11
MDVRISRALWDQILAHVASDPTREVCGLLFGGPYRIEAADATANVASDPARAFEVDPVRLFTAIRAERAGGARLAGSYHSHPGGTPVPSAVDARAATQSGRLWLIVAGEETALWRERPGGTVQGAFEPVRLVVDDG